MQFTSQTLQFAQLAAGNGGRRSSDTIRMGAGLSRGGAAAFAATILGANGFFCGSVVEFFDPTTQDVLADADLTSGLRGGDAAIADLPNGFDFIV